MLFSLLKHNLELYITDTALKVYPSLYCFTASVSHGVENYFPRLWGKCFSDAIFISRQALAWEGDYEMMPVRVRVGVRMLVCHADFSKTTTATDVLQINCPNEFSRP